MRRKFFASLIVCVALLTQIGASFQGASMTRDGFARCHARLDDATPHAPAHAQEAAPATDAAGEDAAPGAPLPPHDHATCLLCQLGFAAVASDAPAPPARVAAGRLRAVAPKPASAPVHAALNKSAPARAPPPRA